MQRALKLSVSLTLVALAWLAGAAPAAIAQQIVAQSNFVNRQAVTAIPQISITVRADFVLFSLRYTTATKSEDARTAELTRMYQTVTQRAPRADGITIEVGQPGNSAALETVSMKEIILKPAQDRSDMNLVVKVAVKPNDTFNAIRARVEKFVADTPLNGRVEAIIGDNQFLGIADPKKHRDALVKMIAEDVKMMQATFGNGAPPVAVDLSSMESRISTRPVGPLDLEVYIPYRMEVWSGPPPR
ncbi:MAG TPA: hypothetical protein VG942_17155 [Hyphomonadaceae bacterium]|nr:hypothetical protein [Hyphomonadaceae bacterium]